MSARFRVFLYQDGSFSTPATWADRACLMTSRSVFSAHVKCAMLFSSTTAAFLVNFHQPGLVWPRLRSPRTLAAESDLGTRRGNLPILRQGIDAQQPPRILVT